MRGKRLRDNGLWEASRMILPQHKEAIVEHRQILGKRERPELDEQRVEELSTAISDAIMDAEPRAVTVFDELEDEVHIVVIEKVDQFRRLLKMRRGDEVLWVPLQDIVDVRSRVL